MKANTNGINLETKVLETLTSRGYDIVGKGPRCKRERMWGSVGRHDFDINIDGKSIKGECKSFNSAGSVAEKVAHMPEEAKRMRDSGSWGDEFIMICEGPVLEEDNAKFSIGMKNIVEFAKAEAKRLSTEEYPIRVVTLGEFLEMYN